jgi:hypothetical protein
MKSTRLLFAAFALSLVAACTNDITAPSANPSFDTEQSDEQPVVGRGQFGSGMG